MEYAIGLDLATDGYAARRELLPPDQQWWVTAQVDRHHAAGSGAVPVDGEPVAGLLCAAFWLARWDNLLFHGAERGTSPQVIRDVLAGRGHPTDDVDWPSALPELGELFHRYLLGPRPVLAGYGPAAVAPVLAAESLPTGADRIPTRSPI